MQVGEISGSGETLKIRAIDADPHPGSEFSRGVEGGARVLAGLVCQVCGQDGALREGNGVWCDTHAREGRASVPWHEQWLLPPLEWIVGQEDAELIRKFPPRARQAAILVEATVYARRNHPIYEPTCAPIVGVDLDEQGQPVFEFDADDELGVEFYVEGAVALARAYAAGDE